VGLQELEHWLWDFHILETLDWWRDVITVDKDMELLA
jgi:hypothetical protein